MIAVRRATLAGMIAILLWSTLAALTTLSAPVPPLQLTAMAFTVASAIGLVLMWRNGRGLREQLRLPWQAWLLGVYGLFGFHFLYFMALRNAPAAETNLINYLWPLLIILFSGLLPGEKLRWFHVAGAGIGFVGAALLVLGGQSLALEGRYTLGYLLALGSAFIWASYSVLSRLFGAVPSSVVGGFCVVTALLALATHLLFEKTAWPKGAGWLAVVALGLGPVGAAFYVWDFGVKKGDIRALGAFSYASPLLSTVLLILLGLAEATWTVALACLLIVGGTVLAAADSLFRFR